MNNRHPDSRGKGQEPITAHETYQLTEIQKERPAGNTTANAAHSQPSMAEVRSSDRYAVDTARRFHRRSVREEAANAMANSAPAAPSAHLDTQWQATRDISALAARKDACLNPPLCRSLAGRSCLSAACNGSANPMPLAASVNTTDLVCQASFGLLTRVPLIGISLSNRAFMSDGTTLCNTRRSAISARLS